LGSVAPVGVVTVMVGVTPEGMKTVAFIVSAPSGLSVAVNGWAGSADPLTTP